MNGSHHETSHMRCGFDLPVAPKNDLPFTVAGYVKMIADRHEPIVMTIQGGLKTWEWLAQEYERQMSLLVNYVEEGAQS